MDDANEPAGPPNGDGGPVSPDRAFRLLSDGTRVAILRALWEADGEAVSFAALRERVGNPDSGRFNYHLGELVGHFVSNVEEGYALTQAGREVVRAVLAGAITRRPEIAPVEVDGECTDCGGSLVLRYDEYAAIECSACGATIMWNEFPPAGIADRSPEEVASALERWTRSRFHLAVEGVCPSCAAETSTEVVTSGDRGAGAVATLHRCRNCRYEARVPLFAHAIEHPAVVAHYRDRGLDVTALPYREQYALGREFEVTVTGGDPWRAAVTVPGWDGRLRLTVDDGLEIVADVPDGGPPDS